MSVIQYIKLKLCTEISRGMLQVFHILFHLVHRAHGDCGNMKIGACLSLCFHPAFVCFVCSRKKWNTNMPKYLLFRTHNYLLYVVSIYLCTTIYEYFAHTFS